MGKTPRQAMSRPASDGPAMAAISQAIGVRLSALASCVARHQKRDQRLARRRIERERARRRAR